MVQQSIYHEHWRRFFLLPQRDDIISDAVSEALFWNDQIAWSLNIIPWSSWRYPFQKAMLYSLIERCPQQAEKNYNTVNIALSTAHGDYLALP